MAIVYNK